MNFQFAKFRSNFVPISFRFFQFEKTKKHENRIYGKIHKSRKEKVFFHSNETFRKGIQEMKITKDICETNGCTKVAQVGYLGSPLCMSCKNQIQEHRFENGGMTMAVAGFKSKHPVAFATGRIQDNH